MDISIYVKCGTGGYYEYDNIDLLVKKINNDKFPIPRVGESLDILEPCDSKRENCNGEILKEYHQYLVTDVRYWINGNDFGVQIYVLPIGRNADRSTE